MSNFEGVHAIIIEDDQLSIEVLKSLFDQISVDYTVLSHHDQEAIRNAPDADVIFLDLEMPGLNGYDVIEVLQSVERFDNVPVVAYTTHVSHMNEAQDAGFHSFLAKPVDRHEFPANLERILNGERVWEG